MVSLGAVFLNDLSKTFYVEIKPHSSLFDPGAQAHCGFTREQTLAFTTTPIEAMQQFADWLELNARGERLLFVADNAGFDWMFVAWYFHVFLGRNPFGFSPMSITSLYKGFTKNTRSTFKHLRTEAHTHNALEDARGNAGALLKIREMGLKGL